jgi:hypothetical protein
MEALHQILNAIAVSAFCSPTNPFAAKLREPVGKLRWQSITCILDTDTDDNRIT